MARIEVDLSELEPGKVFVEKMLKDKLADLKKQFYVENNIILPEDYFDPDGASFAARRRGPPRTASLRPCENGFVKIPRYNILPVYEASGHREGLPPRALAPISKVVVASPLDFKLEELEFSGFESHRQMIDGMRATCHDLSKRSSLSLYMFGEDIIWSPGQDVLMYYFHDKARS